MKKSKKVVAMARAEAKSAVDTSRAVALEAFAKIKAARERAAMRLRFAGPDNVVPFSAHLADGVT